jgi:hypothetical protein
VGVLFFLQAKANIQAVAERKARTATDMVTGFMQVLF